MSQASDERLPARRYGDKEVARILKRATELQRAEPSAADPEGLTLAELSEIATEAGIDAGLLQRAATEVDMRPSGSSLVEMLAGAPISVCVERTVSTEFGPDRFDAIIPLIQQATDGKGTASAVGKTLTWSSRTEGNTSAQQVLVTARGGTTLIRVEESFGGLAAGLFGGIMGGVGGGVGLGVGGAVAGILGSVALGIGIPVVAIGGSYAVARAIYSRLVREHEATAARLIEQITEVVHADTQQNVSPDHGIAGDPPDSLLER